MKPKKTGVSIPWKLFELVMAAEPGKTFSDIVRGALIEKYDFKKVVAPTSVDNLKVCTSASDVDDIDSKIDELLSGARGVDK